MEEITYSEYLKINDLFKEREEITGIEIFYGVKNIQQKIRENYFLHEMEDVIRKYCKFGIIYMSDKIPHLYLCDNSYRANIERVREIK